MQTLSLVLVFTSLLGMVLLLMPFQFIPHSKKLIMLLSLFCATLFAFGLGRASAQVASVPAYTYVDDYGVVLATDSGRYRLDLGAGCEGYDVPENVDVIVGSGGVASISVSTAEFWCNVFIDATVDAQPCATDADGACDITYQP